MTNKFAWVTLTTFVWISQDGTDGKRRAEGVDPGASSAHRVYIHSLRHEGIIGNSALEKKRNQPQTRPLWSNETGPAIDSGKRSPNMTE
ncbi:MAG: hypothetical protein CMJ46_05755 [Planctomyces sp.]|nr:hypothetical protein [Planctomyces sp.]